VQLAIIVKIKRYFKAHFLHYVEMFQRNKEHLRVSFQEVIAIFKGDSKLILRRQVI